MDNLSRIGRLFYGLGIISYGVQQIIIRDFRPQIVPDFPAWAHQYSIFALFTGVVMIIAGFIISGLFTVKAELKKSICLYLGIYFLALLLFSHFPYLLFVYPHKLSHLGSWGDALKELAFSGSSFVMAGSYLVNSLAKDKINSIELVLEKLLPIGRIFFCTTIILFGFNHFVYIESIATMVPKWFSFPTFWAYFGGAALVGSGIAIILKILLKPVALLLATMLFLWFILLHVPNAIANPYAGRGNSIVSAFDALLFCGTALVLSQSKKKLSNNLPEYTGARGVIHNKGVEI